MGYAPSETGPLEVVHYVTGIGDECGVSLGCLVMPGDS